MRDEKRDRYKPQTLCLTEQQILPGASGEPGALSVSVEGLRSLATNWHSASSGRTGRDLTGESRTVLMQSKSFTSGRRRNTLSWQLSGH
jgi:hypothetical protein